MFTGSEVRIKDPDMPTIEFAVAFKGASWTDPDSVPLMVMQARQPGSLTACISDLVCHQQAGGFCFCPTHAGVQIAETLCNGSQAADLPCMPCQRCSQRPAWDDAGPSCFHKRWAARCQVLRLRPLPAVTSCMQTMLGSWDKHLGAGPHLSSRLAQSVAINGIANSYMVSTDSEVTACRRCPAVAVHMQQEDRRAWPEGSAGRSSRVTASIICYNVRGLNFVLLTVTSASVAWQCTLPAPHCAGCCVWLAMHACIMPAPHLPLLFCATSVTCSSPKLLAPCPAGLQHQLSRHWPFWSVRDGQQG